VKGLGDEGSAAGVMPTSSFVDVLKKSDAIFGHDASLEDSCCAVFVEFSLNYCEGLGSSHDLAMVDAIFG
jgi:hypothetical protein